MSNTAKGAGTGFVQGAAAGAAVGGPVGAAIGAIIGTAWGAFAGSLGDKAEKKLKRANQLQRQREQDAYKQRLLSTLRQGRIQRSSALAAAVAANAINSSSTVGALSSIGSQVANQVEYMSVDQGRAVKIEQLTGKAQKLSKKAETHQQAMSATSTAISLGALAASGTAAASGTEGIDAIVSKTTSASASAHTSTAMELTAATQAAFDSSILTAGADVVSGFSIPGPVAPQSSGWFSWLR